MAGMVSGMKVSFGGLWVIDGTGSDEIYITVKRNGDMYLDASFKEGRANGKLIHTGHKDSWEKANSDFWEVDQFVGTLGVSLRLRLDGEKLIVYQQRSLTAWTSVMETIRLERWFTPSNLTDWTVKRFTKKAVVTAVSCGESCKEGDWFSNARFGRTAVQDSHVRGMFFTLSLGNNISPWNLVFANTEKLGSIANISKVNKNGDSRWEGEVVLNKHHGFYGFYACRRKDAGEDNWQVGDVISLLEARPSS